MHCLIFIILPYVYILKASFYLQSVKIYCYLSAWNTVECFVISYWAVAICSSLTGAWVKCEFLKIILSYYFDMHDHDTQSSRNSSQWSLAEMDLGQRGQKMYACQLYFLATFPIKTCPVIIYWLFFILWHSAIQYIAGMHRFLQCYIYTLAILCFKA